MTPTLQGINLQILALYSLAAAVGAPYVSAFLRQSRFSPVVKSIIDWLVCFVMGVGAYVAAGGKFSNIHDYSALSASVAGIFAGARAFYSRVGYQDAFLLWLKNLGFSSSPATAPPAFDPNATQPVSASTLAQVVAMPPPAAVVIPAPVVVVPATPPAPAVETPQEPEAAEVLAEDAETPVEAAPIAVEPALEPTPLAEPAPEPEGKEGD